MDLDAAMHTGVGERVRNLRAGWLVEGDVGDQAVAKKSGGALAGAVDELIGDQEFPRG